MIYLDNCATTKLSDNVKQNILNNLNTFGNPSSSYNLGLQSARIIQESREIIAQCINCDPQEIYFTSGASESNTWALQEPFWCNDYEHHSITNNKNRVATKDKAQITRYFKRYWVNNFFMYAVIIAIITFIASFYTTFAVVGIVAVFVLKLALSQNAFMKYFLNDHEIEKKDFEYLKNKIFGKQLNILTIFIITVVLTIMSFSVSFITIGIYIDPLKFSKYLNGLSYFYPFYMENELFAYTNVFSIFIMIFFKVIEKWR